MSEQFTLSRRSISTIRGYKSAFEVFIKLVPDVSLENLSTSTLITFFERLDKRERPVGKGVKSGIKASTVGTYRSKLNTFFDWLVKKKHLEKNPFDEVPYPNITYDDIKFLNRDELEKLIVALLNSVDWQNNLVRKRNTVAFYLGLYAGLRLGEIVGLKLCDIDFDPQRNFILVRGETSKSKKDRKVPLNSTLKNAINDYLDDRKKRGLTTPYLLVDVRDDGPMTRGAVKSMVELLVRNSGVKFHTHRLRHTFAVNMIDIGCDISKLKQLLGHNDIRMTQAYVRCLPTRIMQKEVNLLELSHMV